MGLFKQNSRGENKDMAQSTITSGYETVFITKPEMADEQLKALQEKLKGIVLEFKGEVVVQEDWGSKKLAYPINKESRGRYTYLAFTGRGGLVAEMERNLRLNESVVRFLSVQTAKEFSLEKFNQRNETLKAQAKRREEEREAKREERARSRAEAYDSYEDGHSDD